MCQRVCARVCVSVSVGARGGRYQSSSPSPAEPRCAYVPMETGGNPRTPPITPSVRAGGECGAEGRTQPTSHSPQEKKSRGKTHPSPRVAVRAPFARVLEAVAANIGGAAPHRSAAEVVTATWLPLTAALLEHFAAMGNVH